MSDDLWRAVRLLGVRRSRALLAVLTGSAGLASAVGLAAVSAWLIARASQMPPVMYLTVAAVTVRALGISRGVLRYLERLVAHDVALRGMTTLRARVYARLADADPADVLALRRGDLLARMGADVDAVGDVVVRGLLPIGVAVVVSTGSAVLVGVFLPTAGVALALCLVLAGVVAPWWALRAARTAEEQASDARTEISAATVSLLDSAAELQVSGRLASVLDRLREGEAALARATDAAARPAAVSAAIGPLAVGLAALAALALGIPATTGGMLEPVELAVVVLTPLAAFEAVGLLPGAAVTLLRARAAARRVLELVDAGVPIGAAGDTPSGAVRPALVTTDLACAWPGRPPVLTGIDLEVRPGRSVAVVGPSGIGKTTLLLTLAGLLRPAAGRVLVDGAEPAALGREDAARLVAMTAEDAHVFDTTVLENLRVARGDVTHEQATQALASVGLGEWLDGLPDGLDTRVGGDAARVSGGERRRLLLARALLTPAPLLLLDEPTEHIDAGAPELLAALLDGSLAGGRGVVVVTHRLAGLEAADEVIALDGTGSVRARGRHDALLAAGAYAEQETDDQPDRKPRGPTVPRRRPPGRVVRGS
jgi:ATP-binding cassette subfamily C protein CydC